MSHEKNDEKRNWITPELAKSLRSLVRDLDGLITGLDQVSGKEPEFEARRSEFREEHGAALASLTGTTVAKRLAELPTGPIELVTAKARGRTLRATSAIPCGHVVLIEPAVAAAHSTEADRPKQFELVRAIAELSPDRIQLIEDLHNAHADDTTRVHAALSMRHGKDEGAWANIPVARLAHWAGIVATNCFGSRDTEGESIVAMYPIGAMIAHSCEPNARHFHEDSTICVQAVRDIAEGEEITHAYLDRALDDTERIVKLFRRYRFLCSCGRCRRAAARLLKGSNAELPAELTADGPRFLKDMAREFAALLRGQQGST